MRRIDIDEEVYQVLAVNVKGFEEPNKVLRRLLNLPEAKTASFEPATVTGRPGKLASLIERGLIKPGDGLRHHQVRRGHTYTAVVEADGWIRTELKRYQAPSPALVDLVGSSIDGWANWVHVPSGKSLRHLRDGGASGLRAV